MNKGNIVANVHAAIVIYSGIEVIDGWMLRRNLIGCFSEHVRGHVETPAVIKNNVLTVKVVCVCVCMYVCVSVRLNLREEGCMCMYVCL